MGLAQVSCATRVLLVRTDSCMKKIIKLSAGRHVTARAVAAFRALIAAEHRWAIKKRDCRPQFRLRKASFKGDGLQPAFQGVGWERILQDSYCDRGG